MVWDSASAQIRHEFAVVDRKVFQISGSSAGTEIPIFCRESQIKSEAVRELLGKLNLGFSKVTYMATIGTTSSEEPRTHSRLS